MGSATRPVTVVFDPPSTGGITMQLTTPEDSFGDNFSHIYPTLEDLCAALWEADRQISTRTVVFLLEPAELELRILPLPENKSELSIRVFPGHGRGRQPPPAFACTLPTRALVLTFWRALRRLQTSLPPAEFQREWRGPFPDSAMGALTALVESWKCSGEAKESKSQARRATESPRR